MRTKVIFMGSRPLGKYALKFLLNLENVEVVGVVLKEFENKWWDEDPIDIDIGVIPKISHDDLKHIEFDFGVSINYWKVIEAEIIEKAELGFINIHHSHNLYYRGRSMASRAILNSKSIPFHGTCLHYTDDGLDTGPIIASIPILISSEDTAWTINNKLDIKAKELIDFWFPIVTKNKVNAVYPTKNNPLVFRNDLEEQKLINLDDESSLNNLKIRAFDFNEKFESAYLIEGGRKRYLTYNKYNKTTKFIVNNDVYYKSDI